MSKVLIIPDVHGRTFWQEAKELINDVERVVFLGDYLDPYPYEGIYFDEALDNFTDILTFKGSFKDKVILLLGNHDMHYYDTDFMDCSRMNHKMREGLHQLYHENKELFKLTHVEEDYLFSHAGVMEPWLTKYCKCDIDTFLNKPLEEVIKELEVISYLRGGWERYGSCIWNDVREFSNTLKYFQIFGHTQTHSEIIKDNFACLDCRECFILNIETKLIEKV